GVNLAASLVLWHHSPGLAFQHWWLRLMQVNTLACSLTALAWLAARKRLYEDARAGLLATPLLFLQVVLAVGGNVALLVGPLVLLVWEPAGVHALAGQAGDALGWLTFLVGVAVALWYGRRGAVHVLGGLALGLGVLAACTTGAWAPHGWLAYHVLV